ncbi:MAG: hypothetical protein V4717_11120 [Bacteroidota bacterium]
MGSKKHNAKKELSAVVKSKITDIVVAYIPGDQSTSIQKAVEKAGKIVSAALYKTLKGNPKTELTNVDLPDSGKQEAVKEVKKVDKKANVVENNSGSKPVKKAVKSSATSKTVKSSKIAKKASKAASSATSKTEATS